MRGIEILERRTMMSGTAFAGPVVDPRQFGAVYNGQTDDSAAIQAAINSLPATGGTVLISGYSALSAGIHLIGRTNVRMTAAAPGDGFIITGVPVYGQSWLQFGLWGDAAIAIGKCNGCQVDGLKINANGQAVIPIGLGGDGKTNVLNNVITNTAYEAAVYAVGNTGDAYSGNTITGSTNTARGLWIGNGYAGASETYPIVSNNYISNLSSTGIGTISFGATISGNTVVHCNGAGIALAAGGLYSTSGAVVTNNVVEYDAYHGIQADTSGLTTYTVGSATISGNTCCFNGNSGIYAVQARNWNITGNTCDNNVAGVVICGASQITATNNSCGNTNTGAAPTQTIGIEVLGSAGRPVSNVTLSGNLVFNNIQDGIIATTSGGVIKVLMVTGNEEDNNGAYNLAIIPDLLGAISGWTVSANTADGTGTVRLGS